MTSSSSSSSLLTTESFREYVARPDATKEAVISMYNEGLRTRIRELDWVEVNTAINLRWPGQIKAIKEQAWKGVKVK